MSAHRMSAAGGFRYLLAHTASADVPRGQLPLVDYYVESGNPAGRWLGSGLDGLNDGRGLQRGTRVTEAAMTAVFGQARDPLTGHALGRAFPTRTGADGVTRPAGVAGYDLTFTAVKSVSLLWALGDEQMRAAVQAAHHAAIDQVIEILEARVAATRVGRAGATRVGVKGIVAAAFDHPDTRTGDPNLHTHVVVANRVQAADGTWRTLDGQLLFAAGVALSETFDALLADELSRRLPVQFRWRDRGEWAAPAFELDGFPDALLKEFSTRSRNIYARSYWAVVAFTAQHGRHPTRVEQIKIRQAMTIATRPTKVARAWADLLTTWAQRARQLTGREPRDLIADALSGQYARPLRLRDIGTESRRILAGYAVTQVEGRRSTWNAWNLEAEVARATKHLPMASPEDRAKLHASLVALAREQCVAIDGHPDSLALAPDGPSAAPELEDGPSLTVSVADGPDLGSSVMASVAGTAADPHVLAETAQGLSAADAATGPLHGADGAPLTSSVASTTPDGTGSPRSVVAGGAPWAGMSRRYTSARILEAERLLFNAATTAVGPAVAPDSDRWMEGHILGADQRAALEQVMRSGHAVQVLVGPAGSGKTATLKALAELWHGQWRGPNSVVGLSPSATGAIELQKSLGIRCETVARWLWQSEGPGVDGYTDIADRASFLPGGAGRTRERQQHAVNLQAAAKPLARHWGIHDPADRYRMHPGQLVIVDEATLAGTLDLAALADQAQHAGALLLLVGDPAQLSAVQASGAFGLLARHTQAAELTGLWRFTHRWEADATRGLRRGDPTVLDTYAAHDRILDGDRDAMLTAAYDAWRADVEAGRESLLIAADNDTVLELNTRARADNALAGRSSLAGVPLRDGSTAGVGDRVTSRLNARRLSRPDGDFVRNGAVWTVVETRPDGALIVTPVNAEPGLESQPWRLPADYVAEHVQLGYAITAHRAQARNVDTAHVITGPGMTREHLYVGMTRGRDANHAYVPLTDSNGEDRDEPHRALDDYDTAATGAEVLAGILATSGAEQSATEALHGARPWNPQPILPARRPQESRRRIHYPTAPGVDGPGLSL